MHRRFLVTVVFVLMLFLTGCYSMDTLPDGEYLSAHLSPDECYTVNMYLCNGGATTDFSIRGELVDNATGAVQNIYWSYHERIAVVEWIDNDTVTINGRTLNVPDDTYDFRREFP